jgi:hypothetical protein
VTLLTSSYLVSTLGTYLLAGPLSAKVEPRHVAGKGVLWLKGRSKGVSPNQADHGDTYMAARILTYTLN